MMRKWMLFALQLGVTALLLGFIFRRDEFRQDLLQVLPGAQVGWLGAAVLGALLTNALSWVRWKLCLRILGLPVPAARSLQFYGIGLFASLSFLGPMGGDAVRVGLLWRDGMPRAVSAMSVLLDRTSGLLALVLGAVIFTAFRWEWFQQDPLAARLVQALWIYLGAAALVLAVMILASIRGWILRLPAWIPGRVHLLESAEAWNRFLRHGLLAGATVGLSMLSLLAYFAIFACCAEAFQLEVGWMDVFAVLPVVDVAAALPISFAGLGVREALFELLLERLSGLPAAGAVLISLGGFASMTLWSVAGGLWLPGYRAHTKGHPSLTELAATQ